MGSSNVVYVIKITLLSAVTIFLLAQDTAIFLGILGAAGIRINYRSCLVNKYTKGNSVFGLTTAHSYKEENLSEDFQLKEGIILEL